MRKSYFIIGALAITLATSCRFNSENQAIQITVTDDTYAFDAKYPKSKTDAVVNYIEKQLNDDTFFAENESSKSGSVVLGDGKKFSIHYAPGILEINFKKQENSETNYKELVSLCTGLREKLK